MDRRREFEVRDRLTAAQAGDLMGLYANEWWTARRTRPDVERMLAASDLVCAVIEHESGRLAAFARVLTDRVYVALVLDVIVAPEHRACSLGRLLLDSICAEPELQEVASIELVCQPELVPLYEKWGFSDNIGRSRLMRRTSDPVLADARAQLAAVDDLAVDGGMTPAGSRSTDWNARDHAGNSSAQQE